MTLLQQVVRLLSESPGNIVYHLVTLFALQAVFAVAFGQWRRTPSDTVAKRFAMGAGGVLLVRVVLLAMALFANQNPAGTTAVLPLAEQAVNTITALIVVWALVPPSRRLPRLGDVLLLLGVLVVTVLSLSFYSAWQPLASAGIAYTSTSQSTIWGALQVLVLLTGLLLGLVNAQWRQTLAPFVIGVMLLTSLFHFWNYPAVLSVQTSISYWPRLGHLVAFPLWAALAYRQSLLPLLRSQQRTPSSEQLGNLLHLTAATLKHDDLDSTLLHVLTLIDSVVDLPFIAVGTLSAEDAGHMRLVSNQPNPQVNQPRSWTLRLADWSALQAALSQNRMITLQPEGVGAAQLYRLYEQLELDGLGTLVTQPMVVDDQPQGLLLLAQYAGGVEPNGRLPDTLAPLATYIGRLLQRRSGFNTAVTDDVETAVASLFLTNSPDESQNDNPAISGRLIALEKERDQLLERLETANNRLLKAETRAAAATKRAQDLAAALQQLEQQDETEQVMVLQQEVDALRESLIEAEEAMAMASAGEGGLTSEWVMMTITRYSSQLEETQDKIQQLEQELALQENGASNALLVSLVQELRTPMTSIAGFTDLLLGETMGILGMKQRDLLQRVQANSDRMSVLLSQMVQVAQGDDVPQAVSPAELVDVREVLETAVNGVMMQIREKRLQLDLDMDESLPHLLIRRHDLHQIMTNLLGNACQATASDGRIAVSAEAKAMPDTSRQATGEHRFMKVTIRDGGSGIPLEDLSSVFLPHHKAEEPLIAGVGDTGAGLTVAHSLTVANGGRLWVDSQEGQGSSFYLLFPLQDEAAIKLHQNGSH